MNSQWTLVVNPRNGRCSKLSPEGIWEMQSMKTIGILRTLLLCRHWLHFSEFGRICRLKIIAGWGPRLRITSGSPSYIIFHERRIHYRNRNTKIFVWKYLIYVNICTWIPTPMLHTDIFLSKYYVISLERKKTESSRNSWMETKTFGNLVLWAELSWLLFFQKHPQRCLIMDL